MRVQILVNTPAHAHLYKHAVERLRDRGEEVRVLARDYGPTTAILEYHGIDHEVYGRCGTTKASLFSNLPRHYLRIGRLTRAFDPDLVFGMGSYAAHAGVLGGATVVLLRDSEPDSLDYALSRPFARALLTPAAFRKDLGERHYVFDGFKESAYLHPAVFSPDPGVREELGVGPDEPVGIVRLNAFGSHHDVGERGFSSAQRRRLIERLAEGVTVFVSDEGDRLDLDAVPARPLSIHPARYHHVLAEASIVVADTQTTVTEAALLGTPVVRSNTFVGEDDMGNFLTLEEAGLVRNVRSFEAVLETVEELLRSPAVERRWRRRREEFLRGTVDLTEVIVGVAGAPDAPDAVDGVRERRTRPDADRPLVGTPTGEPE